MCNYLVNRYVMLRYTESTPLFDERFVNYGWLYKMYDKIEDTENQLKLQSLRKI